MADDTSAPKRRRLSSGEDEDDNDDKHDSRTLRVPIRDKDAVGQSRGHDDSLSPGRKARRSSTTSRSRSRSTSRRGSQPRSHSRSGSRSRSRTPTRRARANFDSRSHSRSTSGSRSRSRTPLQSRSRSESSGSFHDARSQQATPDPTAGSIKPDFRPRLVLGGHQKPISQVRISPDGRWIASASADGSIRIWNAATGQHMDTLVGHMAGVSAVAWAPDSQTLATGSDDKAIRLWDRVTGRPARAKPLLGHHNYVYCLAFSPKGNIIASGSYDEAVFLWDVRAGRLMRSLPAHSDPVSGIDFSCDGTLVVSCSTDGLTRIWDTATGQCLRTLVHEDNPPITSVCFAPNGRYVLAHSMDSCIRLWDYVSGSVKKTYQGHKNKGFSIGGCFGTIDGEAFIASSSEDGSIVMWDVKSKQVVQRITQGHDGVCFWVDVNGDTMVSAGQDCKIRVYRHQRPEAPEIGVDEKSDRQKEDFFALNGTNGVYVNGDTAAGTKAEGEESATRDDTEMRDASVDEPDVKVEP